VNTPNCGGLVYCDSLQVSLGSHIKCFLSIFTFMFMQWLSLVTMVITWFISNYLHMNTIVISRLFCHKFKWHPPHTTFVCVLRPLYWSVCFYSNQTSLELQYHVTHPSLLSGMNDDFLSCNSGILKMYLCSFHQNYMKMKIKRFPNLVSKFNILQFLSLIKLLGNATKLGMGGHFSHHLCCKLSNVMSSFTIKFHFHFQITC
jgi:hypothetical protein